MRFWHVGKIETSFRSSDQIRGTRLGYSGILPGEQTRRDSHEIAGALGLPQSSTTMLLKSLLKLGYLDYAPQTRKFRPTYRVAVLGSWIQRSLFKSGPFTDTMDAIGDAPAKPYCWAYRTDQHAICPYRVPASYSVLLACTSASSADDLFGTRPRAADGKTTTNQGDRAPEQCRRRIATIGSQSGNLWRRSHRFDARALRRAMAR